MPSPAGLTWGIPPAYNVSHDTPAHRQGYTERRHKELGAFFRAYLGFNQVVCVGEGDSIKKILMSEDDWVEGELPFCPHSTMPQQDASSAWQTAQWEDDDADNWVEGWYVIGGQRHGAELRSHSNLPHGAEQGVSGQDSWTQARSKDTCATWGLVANVSVSLAASAGRSFCKQSMLHRQSLQGLLWQICCCSVQQHPQPVL